MKPEEKDEFDQSLLAPIPGRKIRRPTPMELEAEATDFAALYAQVNGGAPT